VGFYDEMAALALDLIGEFGASGTLTRKGTASLQNDGSVVATGGGTATVTMMEMAAGTGMGTPNVGTQTIAGGVRSFEATHVLAALATPPVVGDTIAFNGRTLAIEEVRTVRPAGTAVVHFVRASNP
jgi:hypothetical protein